MMIIAISFDVISGCEQLNFAMNENRFLARC